MPSKFRQIWLHCVGVANVGSYLALKFCQILYKPPKFRQIWSHCVGRFLSSPQLMFARSIDRTSDTLSVLSSFFLYFACLTRLTVKPIEPFLTRPRNGLRINRDRTDSIKPDCGGNSVTRWLD